MFFFQTEPLLLRDACGDECFLMIGFSEGGEEVMVMGFKVAEFGGRFRGASGSSFSRRPGRGGRRRGR